MPMDEQRFSELVERAERALAGGDYDTWRNAMITVIGARASDEQWQRALHRVRSSDNDWRHARPERRT